MDQKVKFNKNIKPIDLPDKDLVLNDGSECAAIGWGLTDTDSKISYISNLNHHFISNLIYFN